MTELNGRPRLQSDNIPSELKELPQWVLWGEETRGGKPTKMPYQLSGKPAKADDPATWTTFEEVLAEYQARPEKWSGIGYVFSPDDPYCGIDLDACLSPDRKRIATWAQEVIDSLDGSYAEVSPSGLGIKIIGKGKFPLPKHRTGKTCRDVAALDGIEGKVAEVACWNERRFFVITGDVYQGYDSLRECQAGADLLYETYFAKRKSRTPKRRNKSEANGKPQKTRSVVHRVCLSAMERYTRDMQDGHDGSKRLYTLACRAIAYDLDDVTALVTIKAELERRPTPVRYSDAEILQRLEDAEGDVVRGSALVIKRKLTDLGNAERFVDQHGENVRYIAAWKKFLVWNGQRWELDTTGIVNRLAKKTVRSIYREAAEEEDPDRRKALSAFAVKSEQRARIEAMIVLAKTEKTIAIDQGELNTDSKLLNVENGTIDLRTGRLREHRREDYITTLSPVEFDPKAKCPKWREFLKTVLAGDKELFRYLQQLIGYCLTGSTEEHLLPFLYGGGANGKSTFLNTIQKMLGPDLSMKAPHGFLMSRRYEPHSSELVDLRGKRFVVAQETEIDRWMNEARVKELTGGDPIRGSKKFKDSEEFQPTHKIWLGSNHRPVVKGNDQGIWRRLKVIPFTVTIPNSAQDPKLPEKLKAELPGILNWALYGCLSWQENGFKEPECVQLATSEYRGDMDLLGRFIEEECIEGKGREVGATHLYRRWNEYCEKNGEKAGTQTQFGTSLANRGFAKKTKRGKTIRLGIALRSDIEDDDDGLRARHRS